ncbi:hypothetical protein DFR39_102485 [Roseateles asaccharophilus]|jgi:hypothetical protein|uniref:DUF2059 domain-containing protein n=2 Tax=Roseateles asaccharophilus TaxID=582607 RepID=A0A4R6NA10_9BURK|nr:hypothetical protein DFR39_102485 [Roseateles asaccharophilus]
MSPLMSNALRPLILAALMGCAASLAQAQATAASAPAAGSSPAKKELVARVLQLQQPGLEAMSRAMLQQPLGQLMQGAGQALQQLPAEKREATAKAIEGEIKKFVDETTPLMRDRAIKLAPSTIGAILEERFSEDELRQLAAWLESPVNKKYGQLGQDMQRALAEKLVADTRGTVEARLKTLEQSVMKQLGIAPKPATSAPAPAPAKK